MEKAKLFDDLKDTLELEGIVNEGTSLHLTSFETLLVITLIDEKFKKQINSGDLKSVNSVKSLMELIGMEN
jgi:acyl carrier protein